VAGILAFEVIYAFFNFLEHGSIKLPARFSALLSLAVITPALHRRHHAADRTQLNTNFGTILSIWDRVFGTLAPSLPGELHKVGLPEG
ncbi:sterol desaturase family protein, partial [Vibrio parahaemolyticus]